MPNTAADVQPNLTPPPDSPAYLPYPQIALAIRSETPRILNEWRNHTLLSMPELAELTISEFKDDIGRILTAMANALESNERPDLARLLQAAPAHGLHRFLQKYSLLDLFAEERILRRVIVARVELALSRQCRSDEAAALHSMIDIMLQQGVLALVQQQKQELRHAGETQLKYLSFLSHDLSNNFFVITGSLRLLERELAARPEMRKNAELLTAALDTIRRTREGMRGLLEHEQLRKAETSDAASSILLRNVVDPIVKLASAEAAQRGVEIKVDIDPQACAHSNIDLLTIVLQNLVGNALKHGVKDSGGTLRIVAAHAGDVAAPGKGHWIVSVADDGPGIPAEELERLFDAFHHLPRQGEAMMDEDGGFGLGLAIAAQAARLLNTTIDVKSQPGQGSTFSFQIEAA